VARVGRARRAGGDGQHFAEMRVTSMITWVTIMPNPA
jgi:hypothetical protein